MSSEPRGDYITVGELAYLIYEGEHRVRQRVLKGKIPSVLIDGKRLIPRDAVQPLVDAVEAQVRAERATRRQRA